MALEILGSILPLPDSFAVLQLVSAAVSAAAAETVDVPVATIRLPP